jgi:tetratricopeptide (TPR) repeat protein
MHFFRDRRTEIACRFLPATAVFLLLVAGGCGDATGVWPRYKLERAYYQAQKELDRADLQGKSGQPADLPALQSAFARVVELYRQNSSEAGAGTVDSVVQVLGAQAYLRLADVFVADSEFRAAANRYDTVASDARFPAQYRHMALMGLGRMDEQLGDDLLAARHYRQLLDSFNPPVGDGGVNREVLALPRRIIAIGRDHAPDSVPGWESRAIAYYDSLARAYPYTDVGLAALGELGTLYAEKEQWQDVIATLNRASDTTGAIMPPYWIDIGEITADRLGDTARALEIYGRVAQTFSESPYRVDADLKRAQIYMRRGQYAEARDLLATLKDKFEDRPAVILAAQLLFASAVEAEGNWERAKNEYLFLITTYPQSLEAVQAAMAIAHHFVQSGETARVDEWYNRADELAKDLARPDKYPPAVAGKAMDYRVSVAAEQKHWDDVAARLGDIVNTFSDRSNPGANALFRLGLMELRERADTAAAAAAWHRLMTAQPNHPQLDLLRSEMKKWPSTYNQDFAS